MTSSPSRPIGYPIPIANTSSSIGYASLSGTRYLVGLEENWNTGLCYRVPDTSPPKTKILTKPASAGFFMPGVTREPTGPP